MFSLHQLLSNFGLKQKCENASEPFYPSPSYDLPFHTPRFHGLTNSRSSIYGIPDTLFFLLTKNEYLLNFSRLKNQKEDHLNIERKGVKQQ